MEKERKRRMGRGRDIINERGRKRVKEGHWRKRKENGRRKRGDMVDGKGRGGEEERKREWKGYRVVERRREGRGAWKRVV